MTDTELDLGCAAAYLVGYLQSAVRLTRERLEASGDRGDPVVLLDTLLDDVGREVTVLAAAMRLPERLP